ncbi:hypothetical protein M440DRAFT_1241705 [Trichoderma longibrachiatum ATCC 18648]|uniref:Uncharacterized protein n=1 Tax=Trichoderma longibrachiatum ATCC 18648 TaxID=983965 RepID=A0A2T4C698_TRILO|nr:hypothetical protein M440DRAFT_1241705 [Trichoderma longibrachiatum ATCC 18648]
MMSVSYNRSCSKLYLLAKSPMMQSCPISHVRQSVAQCWHAVVCFFFPVAPCHANQCCPSIKIPCLKVQVPMLFWVLFVFFFFFFFFFFLVSSFHSLFLFSFSFSLFPFHQFMVDTPPQHLLP